MDERRPYTWNNVALLQCAGAPVAERASTRYALRMGQPSRVIYLPPGVAAPAMVQPAAPVMPSAVPFDRAFFEQVLPAAVHSFCSQVKCDRPVVELLTVDGARLFIQGISGVSDSWTALQTTTEDHPHPIQVFVPYQTIFRIEIHACDDARRPLGFLLNQPGPPPAPPLVPQPVAVPVVPVDPTMPGAVAPKARAKARP